MSDEAAFYYIEPGGTLAVCQLCPRNCRIPDGKSGFCGVRRNEKGKLLSDSYGHPVALQIDPIEKKPLAKFMPGTTVLSLGTCGCNMNCPWCQNASLSRGIYPANLSSEYVAPAAIVKLALERGCPSIAYTYNEPTVFFEYARDIAGLAREAGLKNVLVSNGMISLPAARELYPLMDAANIDMKGFDAEFYRTRTGAELADVLAAILCFYETGNHLELTNLVIPGYNDSPEMIGRYLDWVETHLNRDIPLHFSAYFPCYRCDQPATTPETLQAIRALALKRGFTSVYLGNIH